MISDLLYLGTYYLGSQNRGFRQISFLSLMTDSISLQIFGWVSIVIDDPISYKSTILMTYCMYCYSRVTNKKAQPNISNLCNPTRLLWADVTAYQNIKLSLVYFKAHAPVINILLDFFTNFENNIFIRNVGINMSLCCVIQASWFTSAILIFKICNAVLFM